MLTNNKRSTKSNRSVNPARKLLATLRTVGGMMESLSQQQSSMPPGGCSEGSGQCSVAEYFGSFGELHACFFNCLDAVGVKRLFDSGVCAEIKKYLEGLWLSLTWYIDDQEMATEFQLIVEGLLDLAMIEDIPIKEVAEKQNRLYGNARGVFECICKRAREREMSLSHLPPTSSGNSATCPESMADSGAPPNADEVPSADEVKKRLRRLVCSIMHREKGIHKINEAVDLIRSPKKGAWYFSAARELNRDIDRYGWSLATIRQYAKNIGKDRNSRRGARTQIAKRRKRRLVDRDTLADPKAR